MKRRDGFSSMKRENLKKKVVKVFSSRIDRHDDFSSMKREKLKKKVVEVEFSRQEWAVVTVSVR